LINQNYSHMKNRVHLMIVKTLDLFMAFLKVTNRELIQYIGNLNVMNVL